MFFVLFRLNYFLDELIRDLDKKNIWYLYLLEKITFRPWLAKMYAHGHKKNGKSTDHVHITFCDAHSADRMRLPDSIFFTTLGERDRHGELTIATPALRHYIPRHFDNRSNGNPAPLRSDDLLGAPAMRASARARPSNSWHYRAKRPADSVRIARGGLLGFVMWYTEDSVCIESRLVRLVRLCRGGL